MRQHQRPFQNPKQPLQANQNLRAPKPCKPHHRVVCLLGSNALLAWHLLRLLYLPNPLRMWANAVTARPKKVMALNEASKAAIAMPTDAVAVVAAAEEAAAEKANAMTAPKHVHPARTAATVVAASAVNVTTAPTRVVNDVTTPTP